MSTPLRTHGGDPGAPETAPEGGYTRQGGPNGSRHDFSGTRCPSTRRHGDWQAYTNYHCRCPEAGRDWKRYKLAVHQGTYVSRLVDATGTRRRLQGLAVMGYSFANIGRRLGVNKRAVHQWTQRPRVNVSTADKVRALAVELARLPMPEGFSTTKTRLWARRQGWVHLFNWDDIDNPKAEPIVDRPRKHQPAKSRPVDELAVDGCAAGLIPGSELTVKERMLALEKLGHLTNPEAAMRMQLTEHQIEKYRSTRRR